MKRKNAFTLIEVLVVVGIIALLVSILMPSLKRARIQARRTTCASSLHEVGLAMMSYLHDSHDHMPFISYMPSLFPDPLVTTIWYPDVLRPHFGTKQKRNPNNLPGQATYKPDPISLLHCPDDNPEGGDFTSPRSGVNEGKSYFDAEASSYEYRWRLQGLTPQEFGNVDSLNNSVKTDFVKPGYNFTPFWMRRTQAISKINPSSVWFSRDYDNFHGKGGTVGARRYAYIDGHVSDYEN